MSEVLRMLRAGSHPSPHPHRRGHLRDCWSLPEDDPVALICQAVVAIASDAEPEAVRQAVESVAYWRCAEAPAAVFIAPL
ncbi:hypothetical protein ACH4VT_33685 [Streptomyces lydicus]|uniref:hypothetical protein n=1 Tax=Streptomyces lydicus TaxID=47763 RepID=UPI00379796C6